MAKHLKPYTKITVYDLNDISKEAEEIGVDAGDIDDVLESEIVILSIPVQVLGGFIKDIKDRIKPGTLFIDVCSVKVKPVQIMLEQLPEDVDIIGSHPLFGPKSGANGIKGLKLVLCKTRCSDEKFEKISKFLSGELKLDVMVRTPEEHDQDVAYAQVLTHFIARALNNMEIPQLEQTTKTYDHLAELMDLLSLDSMELFMAIQKENPFADEVRKKFLKSLHDLDDLANS